MQDLLIGPQDVLKFRISLACRQKVAQIMVLCTSVFGLIVIKAKTLSELFSSMSRSGRRVKSTPC